MHAIAMNSSSSPEVGVRYWFTIPISTPAPRYPPEALRAGTSGEVLVEITVGTDGSVTSSRVLRANPARVFDREALNATKRWKFEPVAAPVTTRRTLSFSPGT